MEFQDDKRKPVQQLPDDGKQVRLADLLAGGDELHLCHAVHRVDVIRPFHLVLIALADAVDMDITRYAIRLWCASASNSVTTRPCLHAREGRSQTA